MFRTHWAAEWRHDYANLALGGGNLLILLLGLKLQSRLGWQISFALVGLTSFWAWYANLRRYRTVADTPTSRIASAPQGYIELVGRGRQPPGAGLVSPISGLENAIADRREFYNDSVNVNNVRVEQFPDTVVARLFSFRQFPLLRFAAEEKKDVDLKQLFNS